MFEVIEIVEKTPVRFPIKPNQKLTPGHVVKLTEYEDTLVATLCDGYGAFGLCGKLCIGEDKLSFNKMVEIWLSRMVVRLNHFDKTCFLVSGSSLYASTDGLLTTRKPRAGAVLVGKVISPPGNGRRYMECLWF